LNKLHRHIKQGLNLLHLLISLGRLILAILKQANDLLSSKFGDRLSLLKEAAPEPMLLLALRPDDFKGDMTLYSLLNGQINLPKASTTQNPHKIIAIDVLAQELEF